MADEIKQPAKPAETTTISKSGKTLIEANVRRDDDGVKLYIKGYNQFKVLRDENKDSEVIIAGVRCYRPKAETLYGVNGVIRPSTNLYECFLYDSRPNLCVLLAKNLAEGVTFNFGNFPLSEEMIEDWSKKFAAQVKMLFLTYCRQYDYSIRITTQTVENEVHDT